MTEMVDLDNVMLLDDKDPGGMLTAVESFPKQCSEALSLTMIVLKHFQKQILQKILKSLPSRRLFYMAMMIKLSLSKQQLLRASSSYRRAL